MDSFNKFSEEVRPVQIVTKISDGIYEIRYEVAKMDRGKPVINADKIYARTVFYPEMKRPMREHEPLFVKF